MRLQTYYKKYNLVPINNQQIINSVTLYEMGQTAGPIAKHVWPNATGTAAESRTKMMNKILTKYAHHSILKGNNKSNKTLRRDYWLKNDFGKFIQDLHKELISDISIDAVAKEIKQGLESQYKLASDIGFSKLYNPDDEWFKHYTTTNKQNYHGQKSNAKKRGISWEFSSFEEWLLWWLQTGKFNQRGVYGHTYHMCRVHDTGPYRWDNVYCDTGANNIAHKTIKPDQDTLPVLQST